MSDAAVAAADSVYRKSADVVSRKVGHEWVLVPIRHNVGNLDYVYTLDAVAACVWSLLDGTRTIHGIVTELCDEFDVERGTATKDVMTLLSDLEGAALVVRER